MDGPSVIPDDALRERIDKARSKKREVHGGTLSVELCDALFGTDGEVESRRRPRPQSARSARRECPHCKSWLAPGRFYRYRDGRLSSWCRDCQAARSRENWAARKARRGGAVS